jgi:hypothetical protein
VRYRQIVRLSAVYDLIVTFPFAFPKSSAEKRGNKANLEMIENPG